MFRKLPHVFSFSTTATIEGVGERQQTGVPHWINTKQTPRPCREQPTGCYWSVVENDAVHTNHRVNHFRVCWFISIGRMAIIPFKLCEIPDIRPATLSI